MNIPVTDDNIVEGDETFSMSLTVPSSLSPGITTGTVTSGTVIIIDTTGKHYHCTVLCKKNLANIRKEIANVRDTLANIRDMIANVRNALYSRT